MKKIKLVFLFVVISFASIAHAEDFAMISPVGGQVYKEGDSIYMRWHGSINSANYYGASQADINQYPIYISLFPNDSSNPGYSTIATVGTTTTSYVWVIPNGVVSRYGGLTQYKIAFTQNGVTVYSPVFTINGSVSTPAMQVVKKNSASLACTASKTTVPLGQSVTYTASANMGTAPYDYDWLGSVPNLNSPQTSVIYPTMGVFYTRVKVTDKSRTVWTADCDNVNVVLPSLTTSSDNGANYGGYVYNPGPGYTYGSSSVSGYSPAQYVYNPTGFNNYTYPADGNLSSASSTNATSTSTPSCVDLKNDLYLGIEDSAGDVKSLQDFLASSGFFKNASTGFFGLRTQSALKDFQKANDINQTGYAGPITRAKIKSLSCK